MAGSARDHGPDIDHDIVIEHVIGIEPIDRRRRVTPDETDNVAQLQGTGRLQWPTRGIIPTLGLIGLTDVLGAAFFLLANSQGSLSISAVVASQHPAVTVVLARVVMKEHLARSQVAGILVALVAIALIAI